MSLESVARGFGVVLGPQYAEGRESVGAAACAERGIEARVESGVREKGCVEMRLRVDNGSDSEISEVVFPDADLDTLGDESGFTMPVGTGWWQPFEALDEGEHINWNYPVFGSMQWVDYCNKNSGLYIGVHDKTPHIKIFTIGRRNGRPWVRVRLTDLKLMPGESVKLPPVVVCEHKGDWHRGAKIYQAWAESWMEKPSGAQWYDQAPAWSWLHMNGQNAPKPDRIFSDVPGEAKVRAEYGIKLTNMSSWFEHGHDTHYPDFAAGDCMGGEDGMVKAVEEVHASGLRISLYTNGRIADPNGSIGQEDGWRSWACLAPDAESLVPMQQLHANFEVPVDTSIRSNTSGRIATESYGEKPRGVDFAVMCPGCDQWREFFIRKMEHMARAYAVDGSFIDQICGCWAYPCYSEEHDHARPAESWSGYLTLLRDLRKRLRAINPEFLMSTEGVCDILGQFFDVQQGHNDWDTQVGTKSRPMPELYGYTFPWYTVNTGYASHNSYYYLKLAHAVGSGLDICPIDPDDLEERFKDLVKQIMAWRSEFRDVLTSGEFLGALACSSEHYLAHAFVKDGRTVVTAAWVPYKCEPQTPESIEIRLAGASVESVKLLTESGEQNAQVMRDERGSVIRIPFAEVCVLDLPAGGTGG